MRKLIVLLIVIFIDGCKSSSSTAYDGDMAVLDSLIKEKSFEIKSSSANPLATTALNNVINSGILPPGNNAGFIDLTGNPNHFRMFGDSLSVYLPYFGERQMGGTYGSIDIAIQFDGQPENLNIEKNEKKNTYEINFEMRQLSELYNVFLIIFPNYTTVLSINSTQRTSIQYNGKLSELKETSDL